MKFLDHTFSHETVELDHNEFKRCLFKSCTLNYGGGPLPSIKTCEFDEMRLVFAYDALNTLKLMAAMYHGGFSALIEQVIETIRSNPNFGRLDS